MKYICKCCGEEMEDWPAVAYNAPVFYHDLSEEELENAELTSDLCVIKYSDHTTYRFIRTVMVQKVTDSCQDLEYGIWVSLSEKNFDEYVENYKNKEFEAKYFGWLSTFLPDYDFPESIPIIVTVNNSIGRPFVFPHEEFEHAFVNDFYNGITKEEAEKRINRILNRDR